MGSANWSPLQGLKNLGKVLGKKVLCCALAWVVVYFASHPLRQGLFLMMFTPLVGVLAGGVFGWWMAQDAVDLAGFTGVTLWLLLILASALAVWPVDLLLNQITGWTMGFGGFMMCMAATVMGFAAAIWRASADD